MTCAHDLVVASGDFDDFGYMWHNRELHWQFCGHHEGLQHFVRYRLAGPAQPVSGLRRLVVLDHPPRPGR